jgi:hypothetical protein
MDEMDEMRETTYAGPETQDEPTYRCRPRPPRRRRQPLRVPWTTQARDSANDARTSSFDETYPEGVSPLRVADPIRRACGGV